MSEVEFSSVINIVGTVPDFFRPFSYSWRTLFFQISNISKIVYDICKNESSILHYFLKLYISKKKKENFCIFRIAVQKCHKVFKVHLLVKWHFYHILGDSFRENRTREPDCYEYMYNTQLLLQYSCQKKNLVLLKLLYKNIAKQKRICGIWDIWWSALFIHNVISYNYMMLLKIDFPTFILLLIILQYWMHMNIKIYHKLIEAIKGYLI